MVILVDEWIYTNRQDFYLSTDADLNDNKARSGGGVFVGSVNVGRFLVSIEDSRFFRNW